jgi:hypothetical protein
LNINFFTLPFIPSPQGRGYKNTRFSGVRAKYNQKLYDFGVGPVKLEAAAVCRHELDS